jgi:hypothetical protein
LYQTWVRNRAHATALSRLFPRTASPSPRPVAAERVELLPLRFVVHGVVDQDTRKAS